METATLNFTTKFVLVTCPSEQCRTQFAIPEHTKQAVAASQGTIYCPYGHPLGWFNHKSDADKLRDTLAFEQRKIASLEQRLANERRDKEAAERRMSAARGQVTKIKNRVGKGVCPCCNRTFTNLARHMSGQHPEFSKETSHDS